MCFIILCNSEEPRQSNLIFTEEETEARAEAGVVGAAR